MKKIKIMSISVIPENGFIINIAYSFPKNITMAIIKKQWHRLDTTIPEPFQLSVCRSLLAKPYKFANI